MSERFNAAKYAGWYDSPVFSEREKAAFAWAEAVNDIARTRAPDDVWDRVRAHFSEKEITELTWAVAAINAWNRMAIAFRSPPPKTWPELPPG